MKNLLLKNAKKSLTLLSFILLLNVAGRSQMFTFQFAGTGSCTNGSQGNSVTNPSNSTVSGLSRSTVTCNSSADVFNSTGLNNTSTRSNASYIQFSITANSGYVLILDSLQFFRQATSSAPNSLIVSYSTDSANFNSTRVDMSASTTPTSGTTLKWVFPSTIVTGTNGRVTFRFYPFGTQRADLAASPAASASGNFRLDDISLYGSVVQQPSVAISAAHPSASNIYQGSLDNIIGGVSLAVTTANAKLTGVTANTAGTYSSGDIATNGFKFWLSSSSTSISGATQLGAAQAAVSSGGAISVSGLSATISSSTTSYILVTASLTSGATAGNTIRLASTAFSNITFQTATKTGTDPVAAGATPTNDQTIVTALPTIALANGTINSGNITQNTNNNVLYRIDVTIGTTAATLNALDIATAGTYASSDISNLKLWYSTSATFSTGSASNISTLNTSLGTGSHSFTSLTQTFAIGTAYLYITTDVPCAGTVTNTINANAISSSNLTFAAGTPSGSGYTNGGSKTMTLATPLIASSTAAVGNGTNGQVSVSWINNSAGCYDEVMIVVATATNTAAPSGNNGSSYTANLNYTSGSSTTLGNGKVVYKGISSPQVITGLTNGTTYYIKIFTRWDTSWVSGVSTEVTASPFFQPVLTEVYLPKYMQGVSGTNSNRIPYVFRLKLDSLLPYSTYRYINQIVNSSDGSSTAGAGNVIYIDSNNNFSRATSIGINTSNGYGIFTTDSIGSHTGWFAIEPTGNARFAVGSKLYMNIGLNNGNGGTSIQSYTRTPDSVMVINLSSTQDSTTGSGLYGVSHAKSKNVVMVYDNENGTGRPISSGFVEDNTITEPTGSSGYASFFTNNVDGTATAWGAIMPNINLSNGIRRVEFFDSLGNSVYAVTSSNGIWNANSTISPNVGTTGVKIPRTGCNKLIVNQNTTLNSSLNVSSTIILNGGTISAGTNTLTDYGTVSRTLGNMDISAGKIVFLNSTPITIPSNTFSGSVAKLSVSGSASVALGSSLNLTDSLINTDTINGTIIMSGLFAQKINGTGVISSLTINNTSGVTLASGNKQTITSALHCTSGLLNTDTDSNSGIVLGSSATTSENNNSHISGRLYTSRTVLQNTTNTFGGLGLSITESTQSTNDYNVTRITGTPITSGNTGAFNGNKGIKRYYTINPTTNSGLSAQVIFQYFDGELNGITESGLRIYTHADPYTNGSWSDLGGRPVLNVTNNTITNDPKYPVSHFSTWSFSSNAVPLPVELVNLSGTIQNGISTISWTAANEDAGSVYEVTHGNDVNNTNTIGSKHAVANGAVANYQLLHSTPFSGTNYYQLWSLETNGSKRLLGQVALDNKGLGHISYSPLQLYPNPVTSNLQINFGSLTTPSNKFQIINQMGCVVFEQTLNGKSTTSIDIAHLPEGIYHIVIYDTNNDILQGQRFIKN